MRKIVIAIALTVIAAALCFAVTEEIDVYAFLYRNSPSHLAQLDILRHMAEARLTGAGEFYAQALRSLVSGYTNIRDVTERNAADEQAIILSALLGAEKYSPAAADLWLVVDGFSAAFLSVTSLILVYPETKLRSACA